MVFVSKIEVDIFIKNIQFVVIIVIEICIEL